MGSRLRDEFRRTDGEVAVVTTSLLTVAGLVVDSAVASVALLGLAVLCGVAAVVRDGD